MVRIATRESPLALWQARYVAGLLRAAKPDVAVELVATSTYADKTLDVSISELGGKGAFSKEIQQLVLDNRADIAVHSAKDLQAVTPGGLVIGAFPARGNPADALVGGRLNELAEGAVVATGSNRRRVQLSLLRPDLKFEQLRGNINTRLGRLADVDAIVIAEAALERLELSPGVVGRLHPGEFVPQVGQGALAVECRVGDDQLLATLSSIDHSVTRRVVSAERDFLVELGGDCDLPAGAFAQLDASGQLLVDGFLASEDELRAARGQASDGTTLARQLRSELAVALKS